MRGSAGGKEGGSGKIFLSDERAGHPGLFGCLSAEFPLAIDACPFFGMASHSSPYLIHKTYEGDKKAITSGSLPTSLLFALVFTNIFIARIW